jgi:hypothetical protein
MEFLIYKLRKLRSSVKYMYYSINSEEIKTELEKLWHTVKISGILNNTELSYPSQRSLQNRNLSHKIKTHSE